MAIWDLKEVYNLERANDWNIFSLGKRGNPRGIFNGGQDPEATNEINYVNISTKGNSADFGDRTTTGNYGGGTNSANSNFHCWYFVEIRLIWNYTMSKHEV